jgi:hypothetical protein
VTVINANTFQGCTAFTEIDFLDNITSIEAYAFSKCTNITKVTLPKTVTEIKSGAFSECTNITDVYYGGTNTDKANINIGSLNNSYLTNATWHCQEEENIPDENAPQIVVDSVKGKPSETVNVNIKVKNNPGIASMVLNVEYSSSLTLTDIAFNEEIGGQFTSSPTMNSPIELNWVNTQNATSDWVFATLTFSISENAEAGSIANIIVTYDENDIYDFDTESNIYFEVVNGNINITKHTPGDINGDGSINNKDVTRLLKYLTGWNVELEEDALDVNGDGSINNKDVTRLLKYLTGWDVKIY